MCSSDLDEDALDLVLSWEQGYVEDPADPTRATNAGITLTALSQHLGRDATVADLKALTPGAMYTEPGNVAHFAQTRDEVIVQITGYGPSSTTYVNPADDPARK